MKTSVKAIAILDKLITKCGGQGGTPGPCPSGGGGSSGSGAHHAYSEAHDADIAAAGHSKNVSAGAHGREEGMKKSDRAFKISSRAYHHGGKDDLLAAAHAHLSAAKHHSDSNYKDPGKGHAEAEHSHAKAASAHLKEYASIPLYGPKS